VDLSSVFAISLQSQSEDAPTQFGMKSASTTTGVGDYNDAYFMDPMTAPIISGHVEVFTVRISLRGSTDDPGLAWI